MRRLANVLLVGLVGALACTAPPPPTVVDDAPAVPPAPTPAPAVIVVHAAGPGHDVHSVERQIAVPLEVALGSLPGLARIESESTPGAVTLTLRLEGGADVPRARAEVMARVDGARRSLPADVEVTLDVDVDAHALPVLFVVRAEGGTRLHPALEELRGALLRAPGVAEVTLCGDRRPRVTVRVDPERLTAYGLPLGALQAALEGALRGPAVPGQISLRASPALSDISEAIVGSVSGSPIQLRDLATVAVEAEPPACDAAGQGGVSTVVGAVRPLRGARGGDPLAAIREALGATAPALEARGAHLEIAGPDVTRILLEVPAAARVEETLSDLGRRLGEALGDAWPAGAVLRATIPEVSGERVEVEMILFESLAALPRLESGLAALSGVRVVDVRRSTSAAPLRLRVVDEDLERGRRLAEEAAALAVASPGVRSARVRVDVSPEVEVTLDRDRLALLGLTPREVAHSFSAALEGVAVGEVVDGGERLPVLLQLGEVDHRSRVERLADLPSLELVLAGRPGLRLGEVAALRVVDAPRRITRVDHRRSVDVDVRLSDPAARASLAHAVASGLRLPEGALLVWE